MLLYFLVTCYGWRKIPRCITWDIKYDAFFSIHFTKIPQIGTDNDLDIKLKVSDQKCHMFSNTPHWSKTLPSLLSYWAIYAVIPMFGKICVILMHHRSPRFLQLHLCSLKPQQILEDPAIPGAHSLLTCVWEYQLAVSQYQLFLQVKSKQQRKAHTSAGISRILLWEHFLGKEQL